MRAFLIAPILLGLAVPTAANTAAADATTSEAPTKAKADKICRNLEASVGRIGAGKKCKTAEEWAKEDGSKRGARSVKTVNSD